MHQTNVLEYLEKTVTRVPDKLAFSNGEEGLTFAQVYHDSRAIGSYLASKDYYGEPVVVFMRKHPKCISGFYGCMYGGCYYVPIDEEMPRFRIELIFQNLNPRVMLCDSATAEIAKTFNIRVYAIGVGSYSDQVRVPIYTPYGVQYGTMSSEFDESTLRQIAHMTGGEYFRATDNNSLRSIYQQIDQLEKTKIRVREYSKRTEHFMPFMTAALMCLLLELLLRFFVLRTITE